MGVWGTREPDEVPWSPNEKTYPNIHKTLIEERNYYMARKLKKLMQTQEKILAIVGAGHEDDIMNILKENQGITYSYTINMSGI